MQAVSSRLLVCHSSQYGPTVQTKLAGDHRSLIHVPHIAIYRVPSLLGMPPSATQMTWDK